MNHLSGMDASFLHFETPEMPMHVGSRQIVDLPEGYAGDYCEDVKRDVAGRMHLADVFQRKLALMPFELANPVWADDEDLDIDYHVRPVILLRPGTWVQLERYVARLHSGLLERSRPLWETCVIEGLNTGQMAIDTKMHHAAIDGQAGVAVTEALPGGSAVPAPIKPPRPLPRANQYRLGVAELAGAALSNAVQQAVKIVKSLPATAQAIAGVVYAEGDDGKRRLAMPKRLQRPPCTPLNLAITNQRAFAARSLPLADIKLMAKRSGASLNDIVLAICAGALKRYLADDNFTPDRPLMAGVRVSLREAGNTDPNNQVVMMMVSLATDVKDPLERLHANKASANAGKKLTGSLKAAIPTDFSSLDVPWLMSGAASLYVRSRLAERLPPIVSVAILNVPGPQHPLYFAGAKLAGFFPVSIPAHGIALNVTVRSCNGALEVGLTACRRAMSDVTALADHVVQEFELLRGLIEALDPAASSAVAVSPTAVALPAENAAVRVAKKRARPRVAAAKPATKPATASPPPTATHRTRRVNVANHAT